MLQPLRANDIRNAADLASHYRQYLRVLNQRTFDLLHLFVARTVKYNEKTISLGTYQAAIPAGATFCPLDIVTDIGARTLAARLEIELPRNGATAGGNTPGNGYAARNGVHKVNEFVFYRFDENWHIAQVWTTTTTDPSKPRRGAALDSSVYDA